MEEYFQEMNEERETMKNLSSKSHPIEECESTNSSVFECNICLDSVQDPVVTFCGHLYCWPCIYKWIHFQTISSDDKPDKQPPCCPVCKVDISETKLVPLYGRGICTKPSDRKSQNRGVDIPDRPKSPGCRGTTQTALRTSSTTRNGDYYPHPGGYMASPVVSLNRPGTSVSQPLIGMFGEVMYTRMFGNLETSALYTYPNSYNLAGTTNRRMRRRIMAVDRSLSRISFFLFCCMVLCLLLF